MIKEIAFHVYPVKDLGRARDFYERVLELRPSSNFEGKWVEYEIAGATFALTAMDIGAVPGAAGAMIAFEVDDLEESLAAYRKAGVMPVVEPFETPVCKMALIADPDGNKVVIHKRKVEGSPKWMLADGKGAPGCGVKKAGSRG